MKRYILLVEDNATDEKLTLKAFARSSVNASVVVTRDGVETLAYLFGTGPYSTRDVADLPAVMLLDLKLPLVDGLEVLRRVRADERTRFLPVVILTASKEEEDLRRGYELGANGYVRKAIDFQEFAGSAETLARFWLHLNEAPPSRRKSP